MTDKDYAWYAACMEIIDRCVAPDMYALARGMLDAALKASDKSTAQQAAEIGKSL